MVNRQPAGAHNGGEFTHSAEGKENIPTIAEPLASKAHDETSAPIDYTKEAKVLKDKSQQSKRSMRNVKILYFDGNRVCSSCGMHVQKVRNKAGNEYLAEYSRNSIHGGSYAPAHRCDLYSEDDGSLHFQARMIAKGELIEGQTIQVVRGRKVPKGTISEVFSIRVHPQYGISIAIQLPDGTREYTSINNVEVYKQPE